MALPWFQRVDCRICLAASRSRLRFAWGERRDCVLTRFSYSSLGSVIPHSGQGPSRTSGKSDYYRLPRFPMLLVTTG